MSVTYNFYPIAKDKTSNEWVFVGWYDKDGRPREIVWGNSWCAGVVKDFAQLDNSKNYNLKPELFKCRENGFGEYPLIYTIDLGPVTSWNLYREEIRWVYYSILNDENLADHIYGYDEVTGLKLILTTEVYASLSDATKQWYVPRIYFDEEDSMYCLTKDILEPLRNWLRIIKNSRGYETIDWNTLKLIITES